MSTKVSRNTECDVSLMFSQDTRNHFRKAFPAPLLWPRATEYASEMAIHRVVVAPISVLLDRNINYKKGETTLISPKPVIKLIFKNPCKWKTAAITFSVNVPMWLCSAWA